VLGIEPLTQPSADRKCGLVFSTGLLQFALSQMQESVDVECPGLGAGERHRATERDGLLMVRHVF